MSMSSARDELPIVDLSALGRTDAHFDRIAHDLDRAWRGYFPLGGELTSGRPDRKEGIYFGTELGPQDIRVQAGLPLHGATDYGFLTLLWQDQLGGLEIRHRDLWLSAPLFLDPGFDAVLEPVAVSAGHGAESVKSRAPRWDGTDLATLSGTYGDYLLGKVAKVFPELGQRHLCRF